MTSDEARELLLRDYLTFQRRHSRLAAEELYEAHRVIIDENDALAAEVRRYREMRCESCKHQQCYGDYEECDRTQGDDYGNRTECKTMGGGCLAWEKRDE